MCDRQVGFHAVDVTLPETISQEESLAAVARAIGLVGVSQPRPTGAATFLWQSKDPVSPMLNARLLDEWTLLSWGTVVARKRRQELLAEVEKLNSDDKAKSRRALLPLYEPTFSICVYVICICKYILSTVCVYTHIFLLSIYLSIYPSIYPSMHVFVYPYIHLSIYASIHVSICPSTYLPIYLSVYLSIHLSMYLSISLFPYIYI